MMQIVEQSHRNLRDVSTALRPGHQHFPGWRWLMLLLIAMILPLGAKAQMTGTGAISGTVTDQSGAVIAKATVSATSDSTSVATVRLTTNAGDYNITPLAPGDYTVTVVAKGFETYVQKNVSVDALQTVAVNMKLTVGAAEATIVVSSAPPVLETTDAQIGAVMDNEMYTSLPLIMGASGQPDQRRATDFSYLMPGVQNTYAEVGIDPQYVFDVNLGQTWHITAGLPVTAGMSWDNYYSLSPGASASWFGFASVGGTLSIPLPVPASWGAWDLHGNLTYNHDVAQGAVLANHGHPDFIYGGVGIELKY